jgi:DMSO/TMAO reductase YedYZ heme-binding membrane subunit
LARSEKLIGWTRLGIACFYDFYRIIVAFIVLAHLIFHLIASGVWGDFWGMYFESLTRDWSITVGTISFIIMIPLLATSTNFAVKKMGYKSWKFLHRFTHVAFVLSAFHISFIKGEVEGGPILFVFVYLLAYGWLFLSKETQEKIKICLVARVQR